MKLWGLTFSFSLNIGKSAILRHFTPNGQYLTNHNFPTSYRRKVIYPSLESPVIALYRKVCLVAPYCLIFADVSTFSATLSQKSGNDVMWRHVTSRDPIFTKLSETVSYNYISFLWKFQVISVSLSKVIIIFLFLWFQWVPEYYDVNCLSQNACKYFLEHGIDPKCSGNV